MVASGIGLTLRAAPDPAAAPIGQLKFAELAATTGEASGADGKVWRRLESGAWASRETMLVFPTLQDAVKLMVELRVFSSPELRRAGPPAPPRPLQPPRRPPAELSGTEATRAAGATGTPTRTATPPPSPSPRPRGSATPGPAVSQPVYGVVVRPQLRAFAGPGAQPSERPPLEAGTAVALIGEGIGPDGQRYLRTQEDLWLAAEGVSVRATLAEIAETAYRTTMEALAPGSPVDPSVAPALWLLHREPEFRYLADAIAENKVPVVVGTLSDPSLIGGYSFVTGSITISDRYVEGDIRVLAAALAHEATHAWERGQGLRLTSAAGCYEAELRAFRNQAGFWKKLNGSDAKEKPASPAETEQNEVLRLVEQDPQELKARLVARYADQCGYHGPVPEAATSPTVTTSLAPPGRPPAAQATQPARPSGPSPAVTPAAGPAAPTPPAKPAPTPQPKVATP